MTTIQKFRFLAASAAVALCTTGPALAADLQAFTPSQVKSWAKESSSIPGAKHLPLIAHDGNEVMAIKIWLPANADLPPHGEFDEGSAAAVLVLSDGLELAMGDKFDASKLKSAPAGTVIVLTPDNGTHFGRTGNQPVELLLVKSFAGDFAEALNVQQ